MRLTVLAVLAVSSIILLLVAGCADVTTTQKVGDFGTVFGASGEEQEAIEWFKATYGDPTSNNRDPPRLIEPLVTTGVSSDKLPIDKVKEFSASGGSVYFFVIYDNFKKGDPITVNWTYLENGREVTRVSQNAGGDFGRFIVEFQKPDSGWGKGMQKISVAGEGASADAEFIIGDNLVTVPLPYNPVTGQKTPVTTSPAAVHTTGAVTIPATTVTTSATVQTTWTAANCPLDECNGICTDLYSDDLNCGNCGNNCLDETLQGRSGLQCWRGQCEQTDCEPGTKMCSGYGFDCYDLRTDVNHCGDCHTACAEVSNNATPTCYMSQCI